MRLSIAAFTKTGGQLAQMLQEGLSAGGHMVKTALLQRREGRPVPSLSEWTQAAFEGDGIIFVGACGIAVRAIAPYIRDKLTDPAVVSIDERGRFAVPLLSGHVGGANALAQEIAACCGATAVISTATDVNGLFAVDVWAAQNQLLLCERELAKAVSAALLDGRQVGFHSDFPMKGRLPDGLVERVSHVLGICVSYDVQKSPFEHTLHVVPHAVALGVGCRKGVSGEQFEQTICAVLTEQGVSMQAVRTLITIDLKKDEPCIHAFCGKYHLPMELVSAQELAAVGGDFTSSAFVGEITGVDNVCERAAVFGSGGELIIKKQARNGVTVAAAAENRRLYFGD